MKLICVLALLSVVSAIPQNYEQPTILNISKNSGKLVETKFSPRIFGAQEVTPHSLPYQAYLTLFSSTSKWYCTGALISENYVATEAACVYNAVKATVTLGAHNISTYESSQVTLTSSDFTIHPNYTYGKVPNDIAIIKLPLPVHETPAIRRIWLPRIEDITNDFAGLLATISGWSVTVSDGTSFYNPVLHSSQVLVISNDDCAAIYGPTDPAILCTIGNGNQNGPCSGDSGVPLVTNGMLIGFTAFLSAEKCPYSNPSGYTRITSFLPWIVANTDVNI